MNATPTSASPIPSSVDLRTRAGRACGALRAARLHVGQVGSLHAIDEALDEVEHLVPGLLDPSADTNVTPDHAEARAALRAELAALLRAFEAAYCAPVLATV
jgi:hypothetical protein